MKTIKEHYKILTINPGSTSTKIALFDNETELFSTNFQFTKETFARFKTINDQYDYRRSMIIEDVEKHGYCMNDIDAYAARGGKMAPGLGGVYRVSDKVLEYSPFTSEFPHPLLLSPYFAHDFEKTYGGKAYVVNPQTTDEFMDKARVTGLTDVWRESAIHTLNSKEVGIRVAAKRGKKYEDMDMIIVHFGGGISMAAHHHGRMIDGTHSGYGDGPMAPNRSGSIPARSLLELAYSGEFKNFRDLERRILMTGGLTEHLGTADAREIVARIEKGDEYAKLIYDALIYQVAKYIGMQAVTLQGKTEVIVLTGGMAKDKYLVDELTKQIDWIAPVEIVPGEYEMEALSNGVLRVLRGEEEIQDYTGKPIFELQEFLGKYGK